MPLDPISYAKAQKLAGATTLDFYSPASRAAQTPLFQKYAGNPVFTAAESAAASIYWPSIIRAEGILPTPIDRYYMYYSTDHGGGSGAIYLATGPTPVGPWTDQGLVYQDTVDGYETETPSVIWNEDTGKLHMYYQQYAGVTQSTLLATSEDGETFERVGIVIDVPDPNAEFVGNGHTGYARPFRIGNMWASYHLLAGSTPAWYGISYSRDGIRWFIDPRPLQQAGDLVGDGLLLSWINSSVIQHAGRLWWIGAITTPAAGTGSRTATIGIAPIAPNLRRLLAPPTTILEAEEAWETPNIRNAYAFVDGGLVYLYYAVADNNMPADRFGVAIGRLA